MAELRIRFRDGSGIERRRVRGIDFNLGYTVVSYYGLGQEMERVKTEEIREIGIEVGEENGKADGGKE